LRDVPYSSGEEPEKKKYTYNTSNNRIPLREHSNLKGKIKPRIVKLPPIMARKIL
jgi:hypothetical protein